VFEALFVRWLFNVAALFVASWMLSGVSYGDSWWTLLVAGIVFTLVNMWIKPVLTLLSIPFIVVTLGFFYLLINVFILYVTDWIVGDFEIKNFGWGLLAAIVVSIVNGGLHIIFGEPGRDRRRREGPAY
jgi:putative membrane protein